MQFEMFLKSVEISVCREIVGFYVQHLVIFAFNLQSQ
jgi:hypothetical protein